MNGTVRVLQIFGFIFAGLAAALAVFGLDDKNINPVGTIGLALAGLTFMKGAELEQRVVEKRKPERRE